MTKRGGQLFKLAKLENECITEFPKEAQAQPLPIFTDEQLMQQRSQIVAWRAGADITDLLAKELNASVKDGGTRIDIVAIATAAFNLGLAMSSKDIEARRLRLKEKMKRWRRSSKKIRNEPATETHTSPTN